MAGKDVLPRARHDGLVIHELADETLVYDLERHKAHCLNRTAALIWRHCDGQTSVDEMTSMLDKELDGSVDKEVMLYAVDRLGKKHLLEGPVMWPADSRRFSRRDVIRKVGLAAAVALPLVTTIVAPQAAQAATCLGNTSNCTTSAECCSMCCKSSNNKCNNTGPCLP
jgi:hypothetical protein